MKKFSKLLATLFSLLFVCVVGGGYLTSCSSDDGGDSSPELKSVTLSSNAADSKAKQGSEVTFTASVTDSKVSDVTYAWTVTESTDGSVVTSDSKTAAIASSKSTITLTIADNAADDSTVTVKVTATKGDKPVESGEVVVTVSSNAQEPTEDPTEEEGSAVSYVWNFNDDNFDTTKFITVKNASDADKLGLAEDYEYASTPAGLNLTLKQALGGADHYNLVDKTKTIGSSTVYYVKENTDSTAGATIGCIEPNGDLVVLKNVTGPFTVKAYVQCNSNSDKTDRYAYIKIAGEEVYAPNKETNTLPALGQVLEYTYSGTDRVDVVIGCAKIMRIYDIILTTSAKQNQSSTVYATAVAIDESATVIIGGTKTLTATVTPAIATDKTVTWASSDETVATVSDAGVVTGVKAGTAKITATANGAAEGETVKAECSVTVTAETKPVTSLTVKNGEAEATTLTIKDTDEAVTLTETHEPSDTTDTITWTSSNPDVATVENGLVTPLKVGETTITVKANDNVSKTVAVTVAKTPVTSVTISGKTSVATSGEISDLAATVLPANATNKTVTWSVEIPETDGATGTTIDESTGKLTAGATAGTVNVFATADGVKSEAYVVTVKAEVTVDTVVWDWNASVQPIVAKTADATTKQDVQYSSGAVVGYAQGTSELAETPYIFINTPVSGSKVATSTKRVQLNIGSELYIPVSAESVITVNSYNAATDFTLGGIYAYTNVLGDEEKVDSKSVNSVSYTASTAGYVKLVAVKQVYLTKITVTNVKAGDSETHNATSVEGITIATLTSQAAASLTLGTDVSGKTIDAAIGDAGVEYVATVTENGRTEVVTWTTTDADVAAISYVDTHCTVTPGTKTGTATITATVGSHTDSFTLNVAKAPEAVKYIVSGVLNEKKVTDASNGKLTGGDISWTFDATEDKAALATEGKDSQSYTGATPNFTGCQFKSTGEVNKFMTFKFTVTAKEAVTLDKLTFNAGQSQSSSFQSVVSYVVTSNGTAGSAVTNAAVTGKYCGGSTDLSSVSLAANDSIEISIAFSGTGSTAKTWNFMIGDIVLSVKDN
ncbi:MAG: Ig-like domain-containing protein [Treponema sp.]|nr:Ig-like domain-containing protein [Treponema sp.]